MRRMEAGFLLNLWIWGSRMVFRLKNGEDGFGGNKPDGLWGVWRVG